MSDFLITVTGDKLSGKTTLLQLILDAFADSGMLGTEDTRRFTLRPDRFFGDNRIADFDVFEQLEVSLERDAIVSFAETMRAYRAGEYQAVVEDGEPRMVCDLSMDAHLLETLHLDGQRAMIRDAAIDHIDSMLEEAFDGHGGFIPMTLNIDMV